MKPSDRATILVIDDEKAVRSSIANYLEDLDFMTVTAENGRVGVERFHRETVDLVLVDLRMPEMDGLAVLAEITQTNPEMPLIVVSGAGEISDAMVALHKGAWDYILKPIEDFTVLVHAVETNLEKARLKRENRQYQQRLEQMVAERTRELQDQIAAKENALADLAEAQGSLVEMSRAAGMAEVATGVLHNVGNVLNSVNVSCTMLMDQLRQSRVHNVHKVAELMAAPDKGWVHLFTEDPKGRQIPVYLASLADALTKEHQVMFKEAQSLSDRIDHIKEIVAMQQSYGRFSGMNESIQPEKLMEDAVKLNLSSLARHEIEVRRHYQSLPPMGVDKHKVLQILLTLINNAKHACTGNGATEKVITLRVDSDTPDQVVFQVVDTGMGIAPENMTHIFQHGFSTRKTGHGFGLHSSAIAAHEMGGSLSVHSDGPGKGATFTLRLPRRTGSEPLTSHPDDAAIAVDRVHPRLMAIKGGQ